MLAAGFEVLATLRQHIDAAMARHGPSPSAAQNALRSALHGASYFLGQVLMMAFMAANGYFCTALVAGRAVGYFGCAMLWPAGTPQDLAVYTSKQAARPHHYPEAYRPCCG